MQGSNRPKYLSESQLNQFIRAARKGRYGQRDATLVLLMARHGLRVTEAVDLKWDQVDFTKGHLHVRRLKNGINSVLNCEPCASCGESRNRNRPSCFARSVAG